MDEKEYNRVYDAVRLLGRTLIQNRHVNHVNSISLHLHSFSCNHSAVPHICMGVDTSDPIVVENAKSEVPETLEGLPVYVNPGRPIIFAGTTENFGEDWFDPNSYENTLKYVLRKSDSDWVAGHMAEDLAEELYHEIQFLDAYDAENLSRVLEYINTHKQELYQYTIDYFTKKAVKVN